MIIDKTESFGSALTFIYPHADESTPPAILAASARIEIIDARDGSPKAAKMNAAYSALTAGEIRELRDALTVAMEAME